MAERYEAPVVSIPAGMVDWSDERDSRRAEVERLQAQLAAQAEVIAAARQHVKYHACFAGLPNTPPWYMTPLHGALARLDASPQEARQQAAERAVRAGIVLPRGQEV